MQFGRLDFHLQKCEQHLDNTKTRNTEIESYFVQYLLTRICAEYETRISILVERRCARMRDIHIKRFTTRSARDACKYFSIGDIKGILGRFGDDYKQSFHDQIMNTASHVAWDNIYNNRQAVAHGAGAQMSFPDLKKNYQESLIVLDAIVAALGLRPHETKDLK
jgi:hypothetical protein